ncbi:hypothetical protein B0A55_11156 [Friedmanniomyces simplex]|uniref:Uncharacterized protein n=1 Tax=Friedmanniomyces simplex TaxID=329884 RepID=A0A4U0W933_9PEZI|nr:hypothetical protein B0A55_11156 [Friedmanniomyces simplex]
MHLRNVPVLQSLSVYSTVSERRAAQDLAYSAFFIKTLRAVVKVQDLVICLQAGWVHGVRLSRSFRRTLTDVLEMWLGVGLGANICVSSDGILSQVLWRRLCGQQWHQEESGPETSAETKYQWARLFEIIKAASAPPTSRDPTRWQLES